MKCQGRISTREELAECSEQEAEVIAMGGAGRFPAADPMARGWWRCSRAPWFSPAAMNKLC